MAHETPDETLLRIALEPGGRDFAGEAQPEAANLVALERDGLIRATPDHGGPYVTLTDAGRDHLIALRDKLLAATPYLDRPVLGEADRLLARIRDCAAIEAGVATCTLLFELAIGGFVAGRIDAASGRVHGELTAAGAARLIAAEARATPQAYYQWAGPPDREADPGPLQCPEDLDRRYATPEAAIAGMTRELEEGDLFEAEARNAALYRVYAFPVATPPVRLARAAKAKPGKPRRTP